MLLFLLFLNLCYGYLNNWFPVVPISSTDFKNPRQIKILGKDLLLWKKDDEYIIQDNICPHRNALLSEGYIDKESKNIRCAYHGWEFNEKGKCKNIPTAGKKYKYSSKSCLNTYNTYQYGDLIWVYLGKGNCKETPDKIYNLDGEVFMRELPIGLYILLENFFDPAHVPIAHHKLQGLREQAKPIKINISTNTNEEFSIIFNETDGSIIQRLGIMKFRKPIYYSLESLLVNTNLNLISGINIFTVPVQNDVTRIFVQYNYNKTNSLYKIYKAIPSWIKHLSLNKFLDSDTYLLHAQEKYLLKDKSYHEVDSYFTPTSSDRSIRLYKKWVDENMPSIPYFSNENNPLLKKEDALDRYQQHTKNCKHCLDAYNNFKLIQISSSILFTLLYFNSSNLLFILTALIFYSVTDSIMKKFVYEDYIHNEM